MSNEQYKIIEPTPLIPLRKGGGNDSTMQGGGNEQLLIIKDLSAGVLNGVSFVIPEGARVVLRGKNGSGKTTLVQAIMGNPDYEIKKGKIIFGGADITKKTTDERARMGIFLGAQNVPGIPGLSVMAFLKHSFAAHYPDVSMSEFMKKLKDAAARLAIPDSWMGRSLNVGFSGGEKKRLMFLHLILIEPAFAILDEPDSGADAATRKIFAEIIDGMKRTTFLVISHQEVFFKVTGEVEFN